MNQLYQMTVGELETLLPPRVVSQSLQQGLKQVGANSDDVDLRGLEKVLKSQIYRQLQAKMPKEQAKDKIKDILDLLESGATAKAPETPQVDPLESQGKAIGELKEAMRPYNLYFEWAETQKLRAQLQLLEEAQEAGNEATSLLNDARTQLRTVEQKLEDQLVEQNRQLNELADALEQVREVGGSKVRRLDNLVNQIQGAQESRQLASAEIERARKLTTDLRKKLAEASAAAEAAEDDLLDIDLDDGFEEVSPVDTSAEAEVDTPPHAASAEDELGDLFDIADNEPAEVPTEPTADIELELDMSVDESAPASSQVDLEAEGYELDGLAREYANLLAFDSALAEQVSSSRSQLEAGTSVAGTISDLRGTFASARDRWREQLKAELTEIQPHLTNFAGEEELMELELSLKVTLEVLETTLPPASDVNQVRQLYRLLQERTAGRSEQEAQARAAEEAKLARQAEAIAQLKRGYDAAGDTVENSAQVQKQVLQNKLTALEQAQAQGTVASELLEDARQAAQALDDALAASAQGEGERQQAAVRKLLSQVQSLPQLEDTTSQQDAVSGELTRQLEALPGSALDDTQWQATEAMVQQLQDDVRASYQARVQMLIEQAAVLADKTTLSALNEANNGLDRGNYADLDDLEQALKRASEARRSEQINDLHQLENEVRQYERLDNDTVRDLRELIADANARIEQGQLVDNLERGWLLLDSLNQQVSQQAASFGPRLDMALAAFDPLAKLQTDDTARVRRTLRHLDAQREAYDRVSTAMKEQLEASLSNAEEIINTLKEEYEATRAVAQQLVSGNFLDDMLGVLGGDSVASAPIEASPVDSNIIEISSDSQPLNTWLEDYLTESDISSAAVFAGSGELLSGRISLNPNTTTSSLDALHGHLRSLGDELSLGAMRYVTVETPKGIMVAAWPDAEHVFAVVLDTPANLSLVLNKLRRGLDSLTDILGGAALAS
ncbi:MAG: hypothetical protein AAF267_07860 [Deinococcota bacterium]